MDNSMALAIRSAQMSQADEANLVALIEAYGQNRYLAGYEEGIAVANSDWP